MSDSRFNCVSWLWLDGEEMLEEIDIASDVDAHRRKLSMLEDTVRENSERYKQYTASDHYQFGAMLKEIQKTIRQTKKHLDAGRLKSARAV